VPHVERCSREDRLPHTVRRSGAHQIAPQEPVVESNLPPKTPDLASRGNPKGKGACQEVRH
jgi:hypothetical protein